MGHTQGPVAFLAWVTAAFGVKRQVNEALGILIFTLRQYLRFLIPLHRSRVFLAYGGSSFVNIELDFCSNG
jgi:hypothetical protein